MIFVVKSAAASKSTSVSINFVQSFTEIIKECKNKEISKEEIARLKKK